MYVCHLLLVRSWPGFIRGSQTRGRYAETVYHPGSRQRKRRRSRDSHRVGRYVCRSQAERRMGSGRESSHGVVVSAPLSFMGEPNIKEATWSISSTKRTNLTGGTVRVPMTTGS